MSKNDLMRAADGIIEGNPWPEWLEWTEKRLPAGWSAVSVRKMGQADVVEIRFGPDDGVESVALYYSVLEGASRRRDKQAFESRFKSAMDDYRAEVAAT